MVFEASESWKLGYDAFMNKQPLETYLEGDDKIQFEAGWHYARELQFVMKELK